MKALLVDDDLEELHAFASAIDYLKLSVQLIHARDPKALDEFLEREKDINLIMLDINMPFKNGLVCLKEIKANERYKHIPVIIFTVSVSQTDVDTAFENYAHYYIVKPYAKINFYQTLDKLFSIDWTVQQPIPPKEDFVINLAYLKL